MSYLTVSSKRPHGDEWIQVKCDGEGCDALGPRVEIVTPRTKDGRPKREDLPMAVFKLAKEVAGFTERTRPKLSPTGRRSKWQVVDDLCRACLDKARITTLVTELGGPFGPPADERHEEI